MAFVMEKGRIGIRGIHSDATPTGIFLWDPHRP